MIRIFKLAVMAAIAGISKVALADQADSKIKSCLAAIYIAQDYFYSTNGRFSSAKEDFKTLNSCAGFDVSADYADEREFKFIAKRASEAWSVDESKKIEEIVE